MEKKVKTIRSFTIAISIFLMLSFVKNSHAQYAADYRYPDSVFMNTHSANKATFYSAILPGLGQIYNKKYWKVPIIYAALGGLTYYTNYTNYIYNKYKDAYDIKLRIEAGEIGLEEYDEYPDQTSDNLQSTKDTWRRWRDMNIIGLGLIYVAQILDADVDAHLFDYDVSEDLSMRVEPVLLPNQNFNTKAQSGSALGVRFAFKF